MTGNMNSELVKDTTRNSDEALAGERSIGRAPTQAFHVYAALLAICCIAHFTVHIGPAKFHHPAWWFSALTIFLACVLLQKITLPRFFALLGVQITHVLVDSPFNPDHWLLIFFVNLATLFAAGSIMIRVKRQNVGRTITESELYELLAPAGRVIFLICYGFAAFSKLNTHFLGIDSSCARELAETQISMSPWVAYISIPSIAGWMAVLCESAVALLLIAPRLRRYGILVGMLFHTIIVLSPAIAVFDFTITVFTMLFLFTPPEMMPRLNERWQAFESSAPDVCKLFAAMRTPLVCFVALFMIGRSAMGYAVYGNARISTLIWMVNMSIAVTLIGWGVSLLFSKDSTADAQHDEFGSAVGQSPERGSPFRGSLGLRPRVAMQWLIVAIAVFNGLCPYLGLKTQNSFTMFSNLKTENGHWNHLIVPRSMRVFSRFQDRNFEVASISDKRLQVDFVEPDHLIPQFELYRALSKDPAMSVTLIEQGQPVTLSGTSLEPVLGAAPSWWMRKLMIFRPVTRAGEPYCGN